MPTDDEYFDFIKSAGYKFIGTRVELNTNYSIFLDNSLDLVNELDVLERRKLSNGEILKLFSDPTNPEGEGKKYAYEMFHRPIIRKLNNYLSSCFAFRDYLYNLDSIVVEQKGISEIRNKSSSAFKDSMERAFLQDLRNVYTHMGGLFPAYTLQMTLEADNSYSQRAYFRFDKDKMLREGGWSKLSLDYINTWQGEMKLRDIVTEYSKQVEDFYRWTVAYINTSYLDELNDFNARITAFRK